MCRLGEACNGITVNINLIDILALLLYTLVCLRSVVIYRMQDLN